MPTMSALASRSQIRRPPPQHTVIGTSDPGWQRQDPPEPPPRQIYWMRHGDTEVPTTRTSGNSETLLSDLGREHVRTRAYALKERGIVPAMIISSQMLHAVQSAEIVAEVFNCSMTVAEDPYLNEQDCAGQRPEAPEALQRRAFQVAKRLRLLNATSLLVVSHGHLGAAMIRTYQGTALNAPVMNIDHGQIIRLQPSPVVWL